GRGPACAAPRGRGTPARPARCGPFRGKSHRNEAWAWLEIPGSSLLYLILAGLVSSAGSSPGRQGAPTTVSWQLTPGGRVNESRRSAFERVNVPRESSSPARLATCQAYLPGARVRRLA